MEGYCEDCDCVTDKRRVEDIRYLSKPLPHWQRKCSHCKRVAIGLRSDYLDTKVLTSKEKYAMLKE